MFRIFRFTGIAIALIILLCILTWLHALTSATAYETPRYGMTGFRVIAECLANPSVGAAWCGFLLVIGEIIALVFANRFHLLNKTSGLPAVCYALLIGGVPSIHLFDPTAVAAIFLTIAFVQLTGSFRSEHLSPKYFSAAIFIALATFFFRYAYFFMLMVWCSILFFRPGYWREWVFSLLGFAFPFFWLFCGYYLFAGNATYMSDVFGEMFAFDRAMPQLQTSFIVFAVLCIAIAVFVILYLLNNVGSRKIIVRNGYYLLTVMLLLSCVMVLIAPDTLPSAWYLLSVPLSFILSYYLENNRSLFWNSAVILLIAVATCVTQYVHFFLE
jgi:hypothetical protein